MSTIILAFVILLFIVVAMSVGVLMGRKPISGSCGGLANVGIEGKCSICGDDPQKCEEVQESQQPMQHKSADAGISDLSYELKSKD